MTVGPGKYDDLCALVRKWAGVGQRYSGGVVVIVLGGKRGPGIAVQADETFARLLPDVLESVAKQMRVDNDQLFGPRQ